MTSYNVPALHRANEILSLVSGRDLTFMEILEELKLPRSSVYGLVKTLEDLGFLRLLDNKKYALGFRLFELGSLAVARTDLRREALPVVKRLAAAENLTCHLGSLDRSGAFYLAKEQPPNESLVVNSWEGKRASLVTSGIGKALLAFQDQKTIDRYLASLVKMSEGVKHFADMKAVNAELEKVRKQGWALDNQEDSPHSRCVAAPIRDITGAVVASISVTGPVSSLPDKRLPGLAKSVLEAAAEISRALGAGESAGMR